MIFLKEKTRDLAILFPELMLEGLNGWKESEMLFHLPVSAFFVHQAGKENLLFSIVMHKKTGLQKALIYSKFLRLMNKLRELRIILSLEKKFNCLFFFS
jgi:hypothetical protein